MFSRFLFIIYFFFKNDNSKFIKLIFLLIFENVSTILNILAVIPLAEYLIKSEQKSLITLNFEKTLNFFSIDLTFISILITFSILYFIKSLIGYIIIVYLADIRLKFQKDISSSALKSILSTSWNFVSNNNLGKLINSLNNESQKYSNIFFQCGIFISMVLRLFALLTTPFILSPYLLTTIFIVLIFSSFPVLVLSKLNRKLGEKNTLANNKIQLFFFETFNSLKIIIGINKGISFLKKYKKLFNNYRSAEINSQILTHGIVFYLNFISVFSLVILLYLNYKIDISQFTILAAIFWSLYNAIPAFSAVVSSIYKINNLSPSFDQINNIINESKRNAPEDKGRSINKVTSDIVFSNISFKYKQNKQLFKDLNLSFKKNKLNIIFGPSGRGKTTLVDLLLRLQKPDSGEIRINNLSIDEYKISDYRDLFSFLPQESSFFEGTIKENINLFLEDEQSDKKIIKVINDCNLSDEVLEKDEGINFNIGTKGNKISGGQKQRLALARALITNPNIIVADEPTSSLDQINSENMIRLLVKLSKKTTIILITHDKNLLQYSDNIIYL